MIEGENTVENLPDSEVVSHEITDEQLDKFFNEKGGELPAEKEAPEPEKEEVAQVKDSLTTEQAEEEKHSRNYQAAMKEERARRQELQRQVDDQKQQVARMESAFQKIIERAQQENEPRIPDYNEDPLEHVRMKQQQIEDAVVKHNQFLHEQQRAATQIQAQSEFVSRYRAVSNEYLKEVPDYVDAYNFLSNSRLSELQLGGMSPQEAKHYAEQDEARIVNKAFSEGVNPAERMYAIAKARGYAKAEAKAEADVKNMTLDKLDQIEKGIKQSRSLSNAAGSSTPSPLTLDRVASMDDDEFDKVDWQKLMRAG